MGKAKLCSNAGAPRGDRLPLVRLGFVLGACVLCAVGLVGFKLFGNAQDASATSAADPYEGLFAPAQPSGDPGQVNDEGRHGRSKGDDSRSQRRHHGSRPDESSPRGRLLAQFYDRPFYVYPQVGDIGDIEVLATMINSRQDAGDNPRLLMGSSELSYIDPMASHPSRFFGEHNYGIDTVQVGKAGYQSLWQAMELGALDQADAVPDRKVALIVGMQWFMGDGCTTESFLNSFSEDAYRRFMENPRISEQSKEVLRSRALELGKGETELNALAPRTLSERIDAGFEDFVSREQDEGAVEQALQDNVAIPEGRFADRAVPDWDEEFARARAEGARACTTNDAGVYDEYFEEYYKPWLEGAQSQEKPERFVDWSQKELEDFKLFLQVCREVGVEPLIVIMPVKASYYDYTAYDRESRQLYYDLVRGACDELGVDYADYSGFEDDTYFMRDVMHLGWEGWLHVNRDLMEFFEAGEQA
uniref:D-alanyl-lipoteichoic acid biosynthesis protein DltD n=1 Tax=Muribaculaceae bacterium Z82 TaxID=2304548 RepID=A0A7C9NYS9_9BACT